MRLSNYFSKDPFHEFLNNYVAKNYKKWSKKYPNVVGLHIARKLKSNIPILSEDMAIVFHVIDKTDELSTISKIPEQFFIKYNNRRVKVLTDVIKTGNSVLQYIFPGQNVFQRHDPMRHGTISCVIIKGNRPHLLSNMHVIGWNLLNNKGIILNRQIDIDEPTDICIYNNEITRPAAYFISGGVDDRIDAAIALIPDELLPYTNPFSHLFTMNNPIILPPTQMIKQLPVVMLGNVSGFKNTLVISTTAIKTFDYPFGNQSISYLIKLSYCSEEGDSGAPIYEPITKRIIGIVVGADKEKTFTYAIPYFTIKNKLEIH